MSLFAKQNFCTWFTVDWLKSLAHFSHLPRLPEMMGASILLGEGCFVPVAATDQVAAVKTKSCDLQQLQDRSTYSITGTPYEIK